ncbi:unnamed protein product, partial [Brachionus calyciflorus]
MDKIFQKLSLNNSTNKDYVFPMQQPFSSKTLVDLNVPCLEQPCSSKTLVDYSESESLSNQFEDPNKSNDSLIDYLSLNNSINQMNSQPNIENECYSCDEFYNGEELSVEEIIENKEINHMVEPKIITKTYKNNSKMVFDNKEFVIEKSYKDKIYWRCAVSDPVQCKARIHTNLNFEITKIKNKDHFHQDVKPETIFADLVSVEIKDRAIAAAASLPTVQNLTQKINRTRKAVFNFGPNEKSLENLVIKDQYKITNSGKNFILHESGNDDLERLIILATEDNLNVLNNDPVWFIDGTFEISPKVYHQLFTINEIQKNRNLPLVYAFLANKQESTYTRFFNVISKYITNKPAYIMCDFEKAVVNSVKKHFPKASVGGCCFHLTSNIWKYVKNNGLKTVFSNDLEFSKTFYY